MNRRQAIRLLTVLGLGAAARAPWPGMLQASERPSKRPPVGDRKFTSQEIESKIAEVKKVLGPDTELAWMFENCFPNTLDTTVRVGSFEGKPDTFVITGDIAAMWLRDSSAQVWPYLPLMRKDRALQNLIVGVVHRQTRCILIDPMPTPSTSRAKAANGLMI